MRDYGSAFPDSTEHWVASVGGPDIGWARRLTAADEPEETEQWWALGVDRMAAGIDYLIGEPADRGHPLGSAMISAFVVDVVFGLHPEWPQACAAPYRTPSHRGARWRRRASGSLGSSRTRTARVA